MTKNLLEGITWHAQGEANFYRLMRDGNWLAVIQINGELLVCQQEEILRSMLSTPSGTPAMPIKAYYHEWTDLEGVRTRSVGLEVRKEFTDAPLVLEADALARIACLEGEIAKRDARIMGLESQYQRDVWGLNNEGDPIGGEPAGGYANDNARLRAELAALKAQDPVAFAHFRDGEIDYDDEYVISNSPGDRIDDSHEWRPVYALPVSEAKAQVYEPLVCDYCNAETKDPWHGSGMLNGAESRHIHACSQCRNLLPTTKALAVLMPEPLMTAITRADDVLHAISNWESSSVKLEQRHGPEWTKEVDAIRRELHTKLARLNAAPVQQVSVPAWMASSRAFADRLYMAGWRDHADAQHSGVAGMYDELLAAPAAPAADGWISVSERLPDVPDGDEQEVIVCVKRAHNGQSYSFSARYLNNFPLHSDSEDEPAFVTGWHDVKEHAEYDGWYSPLIDSSSGDEVTHWVPLPAAHRAQEVV